ncbi:IS4 family transposase [Synechococcus sp. PCC 7336]|uniref:IS4 family transposase n=1 Tax=Synechococcus sp. PCC 7336 TaxID=195250 RepID=UPI00034B27BA|nr:IS4 family transposase [Synechococcus sp. PCC 7336]
MESSYQTLLATKLNPSELWLLNLLLMVLQRDKIVKLEQLAQKLPLPILMESCRRKLQRFLSFKHWVIEHIWWPLLLDWLKRKFTTQTVLYLAIDRTQWYDYNLILVSLIYHNRAIPVKFALLNKRGSSNYEEQITFLKPVLELLSDYTVVLLGDREFCGVDLAKWLGEQGAYMALRLKKNEYIELPGQTQAQLSQLGIQAGESHFFSDVKVTKTKGFGPINVAARRKRNYGSNVTKETWYIMSNLTDLDGVLKAYSCRMGIEEMFRDWKKGGYNLEDSKLTGKRFISMALLVSLAYYMATFKGEKMQHQNIHQYVVRPREAGRKHRRHSAFAIGLSAYSLACFGLDLWDLIAQYIVLKPRKLSFYKRGIRAIKLIIAESYTPMSPRQLVMTHFLTDDKP